MQEHNHEKGFDNSEEKASLMRPAAVAVQGKGHIEGHHQGRGCTIQTVFLCEKTMYLKRV